MQFTCEDLGITREEIIRRIVESATDRIVEQGENDLYDAITLSVSKRREELVAEAVNRILTEQVATEAASFIENMRFPQTNSWGEPKREPLTIREFINEAAHKYFAANVNDKGEPESRGNTYGPFYPRLTWLVNKQIAAEINTAVATALKKANIEVADLLMQQVKNALTEVSKRITIKAAT